MFKKILIFTSLIFAFVLSGCGGGGGGDSKLPTEPSKSQRATLTEANSEKVAESSFGAIELLKENDADELYTRKTAVLKRSLKKVSQSARDISLRAIASDYSATCDNGGSVDADKISDKETNVKYHNCEVDGITYNGEANVVIINDNSVEVTFKDFSAKDSTQTLSIEYGVFKIDSAASSVKIEKLYATQKIDGKKYEFLNYYTSYIYDSNEDTYTLSFKGWVKSDCIGGYVYLKSTSELTYYDIDDIVGSFEVSSKGKKIQITFDHDEVTITDVAGDSETISLDEYKQEIACD